MKAKFLFFLVIFGFFILVSFIPKVKNDIKKIDNPTITDIVNSYKKNIAEWPKPTIDKGVVWEEFSPLERDTDLVKRQKAPLAVLGKMLFFDPKLSGSNQISCSSCHDPELAWNDLRGVSLGNEHLRGARNTPSLYNVGSRKSFFWDGRASTLKEQAEGPIFAHHEMNMEPKKLAKKLKKYKDYKILFKEAFGDEAITYDRITDALASFQETIVSRPTKFDRFMKGNYKAMTDEEIYGMHLFRTKARCMNCHNGKYLTDESFHNIGLAFYKTKYEDLGRYNVTKNPDDLGKFKTPPLRELLSTSPWMHTGGFVDLEGIINFYNVRPSDKKMIENKKKDPMYPVTDSLIKPLHLTRDEKRAIVSFLKVLTGTNNKMERPEFPVK